ncbi:hypothetical protein UM93_01050 [Psychromicrobium lacuslunae]|uniref:Uncharacterized protein n=1 Tax=Psychromicrobium lacuslunae TaxID=1618207 RepID=A0A0D4BVY6_9MICC|nr:hypothetical protein UM93_01050 [Psychromicrobium lacuslunae]
MKLQAFSAAIPRKNKISVGKGLILNVPNDICFVKNNMRKMISAKRIATANAIRTGRALCRNLNMSFTLSACSQTSLFPLAAKRNKV